MLRVLAAILVAVSPAAAEWGRDLRPQLGRDLLELASKRLAAGDVERDAPRLIEALKRFRDPQLKPLFFQLLRHDDWRIQHRALFVLERLGGDDVLDAALPLLDHAHRRLREKAALTCLRLWDGRDPAPIERRAAVERDYHVRRCLEAIERRARGELPLHTFPERTEADAAGRSYVPYQRLHSTRRTASYDKGALGAGQPAPRWVHPLLGYGEEEIADAPTEPFGPGTPFRRVGACLDGAGCYAIADGRVRYAGSTGSTGGSVVVEHRLAKNQTVVAIYRQGGDTLFVHAGDEVAGGQLLMTIGLGFSDENGGRHPHLALALAPGPFRPAQAHATNGRFHDPAVLLPQLIARSAPLLPELRTLHRNLRAIERDIDKQAYGRAYAAAMKGRAKLEPGSEAQVDALYASDLLAQMPNKALARAQRLRDDGYPSNALRLLKEFARSCRGIPGADDLATTATEWSKEPDFKRALRGESRLAIVAGRIAKLEDRAAIAAAWNELEAEFGDTPLGPRIRAEPR